MSRTFRRKNGWNAPSYSIEINPYGFYDVRYYDKSSPEYKRKQNEYHRDTRMYRNGIPHEYINLNRERPLRRKTKRVLRKWIKNPNFEPMVPTFKRDAGWYYY